MLGVHKQPYYVSGGHRERRRSRDVITQGSRKHNSAVSTDVESVAAKIATPAGQCQTELQRSAAGRGEQDVCARRH